MQHHLVFTDNLDGNHINKLKATDNSQTLWVIYFWTMRVSLIVFFGLLANYGIAQQLNINYRTATDSTEKFHFLIFADKSNGKLTYPIMNHGDAMFPQKREFPFTYKVIQDTLYIQPTDSGINNKTLERLKKSKFRVNGDKLFDIVSGYTYVDNNLVSNKYDVYSIDGKIYKQKRVKTDGYGSVRKTYRPSKKLKKRIKELSADNFRVNILKGKVSYDKYGLIGMNGVIEITEKK